MAKPTSLLARSEQLAQRSSRGIALIGLLGLLALAIMIMVDVLMRFFLNQPIMGVTDLSNVVMAVIIASCMPAALAERHHITIRYLGGLLPPRGSRTLDVFGEFVMLLVFTAMAWQFVIFVQQLIESGQTTMILGFKVWPWWLLATGMLIYCAPVQAIVVLRTAADALSGRMIDSPADNLTGGH